jgi:hypothetical protein
MWEQSGWIVAQDPYGWFQWYCRFYQVCSLPKLLKNVYSQFKSRLAKDTLNIIY